MSLTTRQFQLFRTEAFFLASPVCRWCGKAIRGPRLVIDGFWCCSTCAFYIDKGEDPPGKRTP